MFRYAVHGLAIVADHSLDDAVVTPAPPDGPTDVTVHLRGETPKGSDPPRSWDGRIGESSGGSLSWATATQGDASSMYLRFGYDDHHAEFEITDEGRRVDVSWTRGVTIAHVTTLLVTTVVGYLLRCRHRLVLHASVVVRGDAAFAFAGTSGSGKSTTVAALSAHGCDGFGDDIAALDKRGDGWVVHPGPPTIRLTPDALAALPIPAATARPVWPLASHLVGVGSEHFDDKVVVPIGADRAPGAAPPRLAGVFLLGPRELDGGAPRLRSIAPAESIALLAAQLRSPVWLPQHVGADRFTLLADVARKVPTINVDRADSLDALPRLCEVLIDEMDSLA
jgi:hypothetical protein